MAEGEPARRAVHVGELRAFGWRNVGQGRLRPRRGHVLQDEEVSGPVEGGQEEELSRRWRKVGDPGREHRLQPVAQWQHGGRRASGSVLRAGEGGRKLEQRERIPARLREQALADATGERWEPLVQERCGSSVIQRLQLMVEQPCPLEDRLAPSSERRQESDAGASGTPGDEGENGRAGAVDPWQVVDQRQDGAVGRGVHEKRERGVRGHELVRAGPVAQAKRHPKRFSMGRTQLIDLVEQRVQELVEPSEADVRLELGTRRPQQARAGALRVPGGDVEQRCLPDARIAGHQHRPALAGGVVDERGEAFDISIPPDERV